MAMRTLAAENLAQAYSAGNWEYGTNGTAYVGDTGYGQQYAYALRFDVPAFAGVSEELDVALVCRIGKGTDVTLRWALCTSDANRGLYAGTTAEVADSNQIAAGTVTIRGVSTAVTTKSFQLPVTKITGGGTYYLILWAYNATGLGIRAVSSSNGSHSVSLGYNVGVLRVKTAKDVKMYGIYVKLNGEVKQCIPYIKTPSGLKPGS